MTTNDSYRGDPTSHLYHFSIFCRQTAPTPPQYHAFHVTTARMRLFDARWVCRAIKSIALEPSSEQLSSLHVPNKAIHETALYRFWASCGRHLRMASVSHEVTMRKLWLNCRFSQQKDAFVNHHETITPNLSGKHALDSQEESHPPWW